MRLGVWEKQKSPGLRGLRGLPFSQKPGPAHPVWVSGKASFPVGLLNTLGSSLITSSFSCIPYLTDSKCKYLQNLFKIKPLSTLPMATPLSHLTCHLSAYVWVTLTPHPSQSYFYKNLERLGVGVGSCFVGLVHGFGNLWLKKPRESLSLQHCGLLGSSLLLESADVSPILSQYCRK